MLKYLFTIQYGGNPVACAACLAVVGVLEKENLLKNAEIVGLYALDRFRELQKAHPWVVGDVRGAGLFVGIDLVSDRVSRAPADKNLVKQILLRMKRRKILLSSEGPFGNIVKIKPPMCFTKENIDQVCQK